MATNPELKIKISADAGQATKDIKATEQALTGVDKAAKGAGENASIWTKNIGDLQSAIAAAGLGAFAKEVFDAGLAAERLQKGLEAATGSSESAQQALGYIKSEAERLGLEVDALGNAYVNLAAAARSAGIDTQTTQAVFSAVSEGMARLGKSTYDTEGALLALGQMMSKGKVTAEELRGQLGERLPGAMNIAAEALGVTVGELDGMLQKGEVIADANFFQRFAEEASTQLGLTGERVETTAAALGRLQNTANAALTELSNSIGSLVSGSDVLDGVSQAINFLTIGFVTLKENVGATGRSWGEFMRLLSQDISLTEFRQNVSSAFDDANKAIAESADRVFGLTARVDAAGISTATLGRESSKAAAGIKELGDATKPVQDAFKTLGVDYTELTTGVASDTQKMADALKTVVDTAGLTGAQLTEVLGRAVTKAGDDVEQLAVVLDAADLAYRKNIITAEQYAAITERVFGEQSRNASRLAELNAEIDRVTALMNQGGEQAAEYGVRLRALMLEKQRLQGATANAADNVRDLGQALIDAAGDATQMAAVLANLTFNELTVSAAKLKESLAEGKISQKEYADSIDAINDRFAEMATSGTDATGKVSKGMDDAGKSAKKLQDSVDGISKKLDKSDESASKASATFTNLGAVIRQQAVEVGGLEQALLDYDRTMANLHESGTSSTMDEWWVALGKLSDAINRQKDVISAVDNATADWVARLDAGTVSISELQAMAQDADYWVATLGEERMGPLRDAIRDAQEQMKDFTESAQDGLRALQKEWLQLQGDKLAVLDLEYEQDRLEIEEKLAEAKRAQNLEAIAALTEQLAILQRIYEQKRANLQADQDITEEKQKQKAIDDDGGFTPTTKPGSPGAVTPLSAPSNRTVTLRFGSAKVRALDDGGVESLIDELERAGLVAQ